MRSSSHYPMQSRYMAPTCPLFCPKRLCVSSDGITTRIIVSWNKCRHQNVIKRSFYWKLASCSFVSIGLLPLCNFGGQLELPASAYMHSVPAAAATHLCPSVQLWTLDSRRVAGVQQYLDCICIGMAVEQEQEQGCRGVEENKKRLKGSNTEWN